MPVASVVHCHILRRSYSAETIEPDSQKATVARAGAASRTGPSL